MYLLQPQLHSRRAFLRRSAQLAFTGAALPTALNLAAMGEAAAFNAPDGSYKALVCVFMYGGNDYGNTVVPYDNASYDLYSTIRGGGPGRTPGGIALSKVAGTFNGITNPGLDPTLLNSIAAPDGRQFALHPAMTGLAGLFNTGQAAVQLNVGPLAVPMDKTQYQGANRTLYPLPPKLFSHNDQQSLWQSSSPEGSTIGWGGNIGDLAMSSNTNSLFTCISVTGNAVFLSGDSALAYQVSAGGAVKIKGINNDIYGSSALKGAMNQLVQAARVNVLENEYSTITKRAITAETSITGGIGAGAALGTGTEFAPLNAAQITITPDNINRGNNSLAAQLKMVARLIAARGTLGAKRQVFFVSLGGFDLHDNLINNHVINMARVSQAMTAFYETTRLLGVQNDVTAFTASDFGRTMTSNGDGSDHGWGNHHLMVGGAVRGKAFYGYAPPAGTTGVAVDKAVNHAWEVGQGRLLPTTSVDQYAATLASWFGVSDAELKGTAANNYRDAVLPGLHNFGGTAGANGIAYPTN
jgi:uncharacterized protein (DUF1501 family)